MRNGRRVYGGEREVRGLWVKQGSGKVFRGFNLLN